uniref:Arginase n=1 Tax=Mesocestoides corti TaxID=53468 RepID=A0A5K3ES52_MESCO
MGNVPSKQPASVGVVGAAFNKGQDKDGVQNGPATLRGGGLQEALNATGAKVTDYGDVTQPIANEPDKILNCSNQRALIKSTLEIAEAVEKSVSENDLTLILGGDHSLGTGSITGHFRAYPNSFVVWVDAHADINTPEASESSHTHGMPLAFIVKETNQLVPQVQGFEKIKPALAASQLIYIGLRDVDKTELKFLKEFSITYFDMHDVKKLGIECVMDIVLRIIAERRPHCKIHLSFDIDALDPSFAPSTGTPVPGGLTLKEGKYICRTLAQTGQLKSMDMAEVNPALGSPEDVKTTVESATELLKSALLYQ